MRRRTGSVRLLGRDPVLTTLAQLAHSARRGSAHCVIVRGRRGSGKTALLHEVAEHATRSGDLVLTPEAGADQSALWAISELLEPTGARIGGAAATLYPVLRRVHRTLARLTAAKAACLLLDDLRTDDEATLSWFDFTLRRSEGLPLFIVATTVSDSSESPLVNLAVHANCTVLDLPPLPLSATAAIMARDLEAGAEPWQAEVCHRLSAGNPGALVSLLDRLRERRGAVASPDGGVLDPELVTTSVISRLGALSDRTRAVATAVAVLGRTDPDLVGPLAGLAPSAVPGDLHALCRDHLHRHDQPEPLWESTRAAILSTVPTPELTALRTRAAMLLLDNGRPADEVAEQLLALDRADQPWMSQVLVGAAAAASARGDAATAVHCLTRALEGDPANLPARTTLAMRQTRTDPVAAMASLAEVFERSADPVLRARIAVAHALAARTCGQPLRGRGLLLCATTESPASSGGHHGDEDLRALLDAALLAVTLADPATATTAAARHAAGIRVPEGRTASRQCLLAMIADTTMRIGGDVAEAVQLARQAVAGDSVDDWSTPAAAEVLRCAGRFDEAEAALDRAVSRFTAEEDELGLCRLFQSRARGLVATGSLTEAESEARTAFAIAERNSWLSHEPGIAITLALVNSKLGRPLEAQALLDDVGRASVSGRTTEHHEFLHASAWAAIARNDWCAAIDALFECGRVMTGSGISNPVLVPWWVEAAIISALLVGRCEPADEALEAGRTMARRWHTPESAALVTMVEGVINSDIALLADASRSFSGLPTRQWQAFSELGLGRVHVMAGQNVAARSHLRKAISLMLSNGTSPCIDEARRLLHLAGGRMRVRPGAAHDVLSASERRVVDLAAAGATNREIANALYVSLRTVEIHLTKAYRKLGISGRSQLRAACTIEARSG
ncbi:LuxR family transcriptional regulator [Lentzea sp. HUAS12]|uniref:helix-turn-helix transcriptional regulator n=1 Tax=Lentzea sp. HUAS12 TaxID=2951806 RepID=UPI0020A01ACC|nr:LuxR family transcriptional regulator [Lentzea sp. HUAS12]USX53989.1 AAA family ATPase [Lentzea sp. HUAS12]